MKTLYGHTLAREFGPRALAAVRQQMMDVKLCRTLINRRVDRVKRVFKWAAAEELVSVTTYQSLRTLARLPSLRQVGSPWAFPRRCAASQSRQGTHDPRHDVSVKCRPDYYGDQGGCKGTIRPNSDQRMRYHGRVVGGVSDALAKQMYDSREFGAMPILADALQDAGCDNTDILEHCRGDGPHVRGCWVLDLVLGKE